MPCSPTHRPTPQNDPRFNRSAELRCLGGRGYGFDRFPRLDQRAGWRHGLRDATGQRIKYDRVYYIGEQDYYLPKDPPARGLECWVIATGSAGAFVYSFQQPGTYAYLSHNLIEALLLGVVSHVKVEGPWNNDLMEQVKKPSAVN